VRPRYINFSEEELAHWIVPRDGVVDAFVVEREGVITDFCSYYYLPSSILKHPKHTTLNAMYSFYNVATSVSLEVLMTDCLIKARDAKCDVFNCLDLMQNAEFLKPLKFGIGDGKLQYYLYNWMCPEVCVCGCVKKTRRSNEQSVSLGVAGGCVWVYLPCLAACACAVLI
jgi:glycylpeptide N-tetradecanoyltransferase